MSASCPASPVSLFSPAGLQDLVLQDLAPGLSQHARLISIDTPVGSGALVVERFSGSDAMSELFHFEVDCILPSEHVPLETLPGKELTLRLRLASGIRRSIHGIATRIRVLDGGGQPRCQLTLEPWLKLLALRRDSYVFQDKTVLEIVADVLADYGIANYRFDVGTALPKRSLAMQYRESDYDFIRRLLAEEGLNFYFAHEQDAHGGAAQREEKESARHQFVVFDDNAALVVCPQPAIRYHRASAAETADTIVRFTQRTQVTPNVVTLASWDYKKLFATSGESNLPAPGNCPALEVFEGAGAYRYADVAESSRIAQARAESLLLSQQRFAAESTARSVAPGTCFALTDHPTANGEYAVLAVTHAGTNNLASADGESGAQPETYRNQFTAVARTTRIRPAYSYPKPSANGTQSALVVGVRSEEISTGRDHRVKIQFPWQRGDHAAPGQLAHPAASNAPGDETAGTWVRVAEPCAGGNWGAHFIPRIGQEVCVDFIHGDIDRPVVTGQLYNGADTPRLHGADNHAGALSGIRTKEYAAAGFSQWLMDDTPGQLRQTLATSGAASQFNAGYLIRQAGNQRGSFRGIGFELATDAWSTLRAKRGLFLSTTQRANGTSFQLNVQEAQGRLEAATDMAASLSAAASRHHAPHLVMPQRVQQLRKDVDAPDKQQVPAFAQPLVLFDSSAGVAAATPASAVMFTGQDLTMTSRSGLRITAGEAVSLAAAETASLFTHAGGVKAIAAKGTVSVRANTGAMDLLADKAISVTSSNGDITVQAKEEILLASGGGYIRLTGQNIDIHCPASVSVKGVTHGFLGAGSKPAESTRLPDTRQKSFDEQFQALDQVTGKPIAGLPYRIGMPDGTVLTGTTDDQGRTMRVATADPEALQLFFGRIADDPGALNEDS